MANVSKILGYDIKDAVARQANGKVLWTNNSHTSEFASGVVQISEALSNYDYYEIIYKIKANESTYDIFGSTGRIPTNHKCVLFTASISDTETNNNLYVGYRRVKSINGKNIDFGAGYYYSAHNAGDSSNNWCVPYQIIGYKIW